MQIGPQLNAGGVRPVAERPVGAVVLTGVDRFPEIIGARGIVGHGSKLRGGLHLNSFCRAVMLRRNA